VSEETQQTIQQPVAVDDYDALLKMFVARRMELGLTSLEVDDLAGLQNGYTSKIEARIKNFGPISLPCLCSALGLQITVARVEPHRTVLGFKIRPETLQRRRAYWKKLGLAG
jgi:hypothetical protein